MRPFLYTIILVASGRVSYPVYSSGMTRCNTNVITAAGNCPDPSRTGNFFLHVPEAGTAQTA